MVAVVGALGGHVAVACSSAPAGDAQRVATLTLPAVGSQCWLSAVANGADDEAVVLGEDTLDCAGGALVTTAGEGEPICLLPGAGAVLSGLTGLLASGAAMLLCGDKTVRVVPASQTDTAHERNDPCAGAPSRMALRQQNFYFDSDRDALDAILNRSPTGIPATKSNITSKSNLCRKAWQFQAGGEQGWHANLYSIGGWTSPEDPSTFAGSISMCPYCDDASQSSGYAYMAKPRLASGRCYATPWGECLPDDPPDIVDDSE
jgi:hypothetical protein